MAVYVLKFKKPLGSHRHKAEYYIGFCEEGNLDNRLKTHRRGHGAAITKAAIERGIDFEVVLYLPGLTRDDERRIKHQHNHKRFVERELRKQGQAQ